MLCNAIRSQPPQAHELRGSCSIFRLGGGQSPWCSGCRGGRVVELVWGVGGAVLGAAVIGVEGRVTLV